MKDAIEIVWRHGKQFVNGVEMDDHELAALMASRGIKYEQVQSGINYTERLLRIISGGADCSLCGAVGDEPCLDERGEPLVADAWHVARCAKTTNEPVEGTSPPIISTSWDNHTADIKLDILRIDEMMRAEHQKQQDMMREHLTKIQQRIWGNREEILTAFVAKYGPVDPLDVVQITTQELYWPYGTKWMLYLRNKTDEEKITPPSLFPPRKSEYGQSEILVTKHGVYSDPDFIVHCDEPDEIPHTD